MATINKTMKTFNVPSGSDTISYEIFDDKGRKCIAKDWYANSTAKFSAGEYVIKDGVCYKFKVDHAANSSWSASEVVATNLGSELSDVKSALSDVETIVYQGSAIDFSTAEYKTGQIGPSSGKWTTGSGRTYFIPPGDAKFTIITAGTNDALVAMLQNDTITNNATPDYAGGTTKVIIPAGQTAKLYIPSDCHYIGVKYKTSTDDVTPSSMYLDFAIPIVSYDRQTPTDEQKQIARINIGAVSSAFGSYPVAPFMFNKSNLNSSGSVTGNSEKVRTSTYLYLHSGCKISVTGDYYFHVYQFDRDKSFVNRVTTLKQYTLLSDGYYRIVIRKDDGTDYTEAQGKAAINALSIVDCRNPALIPAEFKFVLPELVPVASGREMNIYYQNVVYGYNTQHANRILTDSNSFENHNGFSRWTPNTSSSGNGAANYINLYANNSLNFDMSGRFSIQAIGSNSGSGLTKKVLIIGDSLTGGYATVREELVNLFANDSMHIQLVGTHHSAPYQDEAYSGWGYYTFYNNQTRGESDLTINPFWNPAVEHFDFSYYMAQSGIEAPDYVLLCLGTNDLNRTDEVIKECADAIIESIHDYSSTIKIGVWLPPVPATLEHENDGASVMYHVISFLINEYSGRQSEEIYTIPVYLNIDTKHDYRTVEENISARNSDYKIRFATDNLHPTVAGFEKIADVLYSFIKYLGGM